jgi:hypothetical protein
MAKKRKIDIGWYVHDPKVDAILMPPEPISREFATNSPNYGQCPAIWDAYGQLFVVRSYYDIELRVDPQTGMLSGYPKYVKGGKKTYTDSFVHLPPKLWRHPNFPISQFKLKIGIASDEPNVFAAILPPFLHEEMLRRPIRIIPGLYNIYDWPFRHLNMAWEWLDCNQTLTIKRGEPVCYIQFQHPSINEVSYRMVEVDRQAPAVMDVAVSTQGFFEVIRGHAKSVMKAFGQRRPKKLVIPRRK